MTWEKIRGNPQGPGRKYGTEWVELPAAAVNKGGLTFNRAASEAFDFEKGAYFFVLFESNPRRIGLKRAVNGESLEGSYRMRSTTSTKKGGATFIIACHQLIPRIMDCTGKAFRAHLNAGERVIEISLDASNVCK